MGIQKRATTERHEKNLNFLTTKITQIPQQLTNCKLQYSNTTE